MPKFKPGETSVEGQRKKEANTRSILLKADLLKKIKGHEDIPESLKINGVTIPEYAVHKWHDEKLGIISCAWNTAHSEGNKKALNKLLKSIAAVNKRLIASTKNSESQHKKSSYNPKDPINVLKKQNSELKSALAEVYRAYIQLIDKYREDEQIDESYRKLILDQSRILGRHRMQIIK
jgi:hypothetical protein